MNSARGFRAVLSLLGLVAAEVGAVVALHRLGGLPFLQMDWQDPLGWLRITAPDDVLLTLCRLVALAGAYWLVGGTLLYTGARALRVPAAIRAVEWAAVPAVRRLADRAVAVTLATSSLVSGAGGVAWAEGPPAPPENPPPVVRVVPGGALLPPGMESPSAQPTAEPAPVTLGVAVSGQPEAWEDAPGVPTPGRESPEAAAHVVVPGDDLWSIASDHLATFRARDARSLTLEEVAAYWRQVVDVNRHALRSADPDLLLPGEVVQLPSPSAPAACPTG